MASGSPDLIPPVYPARVKAWVETSVQRFRSPWKGTEQRTRRFHLWRMQWEWRLLERTDAAQVLPLLDFYNTAEAFKVYDPTRESPSGAASVAELATLQTNAATPQTGRSLIVDGGPASKLCFKAYDLIGLDYVSGGTNYVELFELKSDFTTDASGAGTINLCQYIRNPVPDNTPIVVYRPCIRVRLDTAVEPEVYDTLIYEFNASFTEHITLG